MRSRQNAVRTGVLIGTIALAAAGLSALFLRTDGPDAHAGTLLAGLNFAIGIDTNHDGFNDCGTGVPSAVGDGAPDPVAAEVTNETCNAPLGATLNTYVYLMDNGGISYSRQQSLVYDTGPTSKGYGNAVWTGCAVEAPDAEPGYERAPAPSVQRLRQRPTLV